jgi:hypothetical protein
LNSWRTSLSALWHVVVVNVGVGIVNTTDGAVAAGRSSRRGE